MTTTAQAALSVADLRRVLDVAAEVTDCAGLPEFVQRAAGALGRLVPCDFASYNIIDPVSNRAQLSTMPEDVLFDGAAEALARNLDEHPIVAHFSSSRALQSCRLSQFISQRQFHDLGLYSEVFRHLDNEYLLAAAPLVLPAPVIVGFGLHRHAQDFTDRELALVDLAGPSLAHAYELTMARIAVRSLDAVLDHEDMAVVVVDEDGRVVHATARATDILAELAGHRCGRGTLLPVPLEGPGGGQARRGRHRNLEWECVPRDDAYRAVVFKTAPEPGWGLSRREREVLALVAEGGTNGEIAAVLQISVHTVRRHVEAVFRKLGVSTRSAAAAAFLRAATAAGPPGGG